MGRKGPRAKTKTVLKPVNKMKQLVGMPMTNKEKNLNKNHPTKMAHKTGLRCMVEGLLGSGGGDRGRGTLGEEGCGGLRKEAVVGQWGVRGCQ